MVAQFEKKIDDYQQIFDTSFLRYPTDGPALLAFSAAYLYILLTASVLRYFRSRTAVGMGGTCITT